MLKDDKYENLASAPYPIVIFDIDGTLINTIDLIVASYRHALMSVVGEEGDETEIRRWIGRPLMDAFGSLHPDKAPELLDTYLEWNHQHTPEMLAEYEGVSQMIDDLLDSSLRIGAATSKRREPARWCLELAGLAGRVPLLAAAEDTTAHKPHPEPLLHALAHLGGHPSEAVYVGDAVVDIQAAHAAGMDSIAVTWGAGVERDLRDGQPTAMVNTIGQLTNILLGSSPTLTTPPSEGIF
ncbi:MAG: HAD-IA family hydrolase [Propionibacteriaceae bacterium]|nr:HAD-IA family hydrolase [Propionibacteriaceae bacterium]